MDMDTPFELLASQPFLAGLTPGQLDKLSLWSKRKVFHAGVRLFEEGARADRFWLLREGHVTLDTHVPGRGNVIVETLGPGAVLGWSSPRSTSRSRRRCPASSPWCTPSGSVRYRSR